MKIYCIFLLVIITQAEVWGQWTPMVRQSFESSDKKSEPAAFLATFPKGKGASFLIDGGIGLEKELSLNRLYFKAVVEYHRNTLIEKKQNNGQLGGGIEWFIRPAEKQNNGIVTSDLKYVRDAVADKASVVWAGEITPFSKIFNKPIYRCNKVLAWVLSPAAGFEYQNTFDAPEATKDSLRGNILRGVLKGKVSLSLLDRPARVGGIAGPTYLQLYVNTAFRYDVVNTTETPAGWHPYLDTGLIFYPVHKQNNKFSLGLSYVNGENPAKGLARQEYFLFAFRVKI
ncbi:hypothetical protein [Dyadobacter sp. 3J3]|uniref:hypothetical protein n=1 Tax=Dyadobacter sp. 3J3 TaxID=2606600 RepID=UPI00135C2E6E|nr:hypothetical protein [Dyadobacter sp. 3J3]